MPETEVCQKVSVVMATYNGERFLDAAFASIGRQSIPPLEVVVVDDGSTDRSVEIARGNGARVIELSHSGVCVARNTGIQAASAPFIALMDQDDEWHPQKLERQLAALEQFPDSVIVATDLEKIDALGHVFDPSFLIGTERRYDQLHPTAVSGSVEYFADIAAQIHRAGWFLLPSAVLVRRDVLVAAGMFDERITLNEDVACFLRVLGRGPLTVVREALTRWRIHGSNTHLDITRMLRGRLCLSREALARPESFPAGYVELLREELVPLLRSVGRLELEAGKKGIGRALLREANEHGPDARTTLLLAISAGGGGTFDAAIRAARFIRRLKRRIGRGGLSNAPP